MKTTAFEFNLDTGEPPVVIPLADSTRTITFLHGSPRELISFERRAGAFVETERRPARDLKGGARWDVYLETRITKDSSDGDFTQRRKR